MLKFHKDKQKYFNWQFEIGKNEVIPFLNDAGLVTHDKRVLEIGCGEAGVLKAFAIQPNQCWGIELAEHRAKLARQFLAAENLEVTILNENIYNIDPSTAFESKFDIIILKDVIEHIPDQAKFFDYIGDFLNPGGVIFFGFPPWHMPFGGHQQICESRLLQKTPYIHLLPRPIYRGILRLAKEPDIRVNELLELKDTGITIERFEKLSRQNGFQILKRRLYLTNPIYKFKFGLKTLEQLPILRSLPYVRNILTTCAYYVIQKHPS